MIQDIFPHNFDIAFQDKMPEAGSKVIIMSEGKIFVVEENEQIDFPEFAKMNESSMDDKMLQYLFSLDNVEYYRCHLEKMNDVSLITDVQGNWKTRHELRVVKPKEYTLVAITAMHLDGWYEKSKFCGVCGARTVHDKKERMMRCPDCGNMIFPRINPAVIVGVTHEDKILLTKYRGREYKNYALIAGFTEIGESFEETVRREVMEEAGIKVKNIRYYKSQPWGFSDNILAGYFCEVDGDSEIKMDKDELSVAEWVDRADIPSFMEDLSLTHEMIQKFKVDN